MNKKCNPEKMILKQNQKIKTNKQHIIECLQILKFIRGAEVKGIQVSPTNYINKIIPIDYPKRLIWLQKCKQIIEFSETEWAFRKCKDEGCSIYDVDIKIIDNDIIRELEYKIGNDEIDNYKYLIQQSEKNIDKVYTMFHRLQEREKKTYNDKTVAMSITNKSQIN
jgi:hypothetical protein